MVRAPAHPRRGLIAFLVWGQAACAFDTGGGAGRAEPGDDVRPAADGAPVQARDGAPAAAACPDDGDLLVCLTFEGSAVDGSSYRNAIEVAGATSFVDGIDGLALDAGDGVDVTITETELLDPPAPLLIDLWARADALPAADTRAGLVDNEGQWGFFVYPGGRVGCSMSGYADAEAVLAVGEWTHLACAYDGSAVRLFRAGALVAEASAGSALSAGGIDGTAVARNSPSGQYFDGRIDELRIWRRGAP